MTSNYISGVLVIALGLVLATPARAKDLQKHRRRSRSRNWGCGCGHCGGRDYCGRSLFGKTVDHWVRRGVWKWDDYHR